MIFAITIILYLDYVMLYIVDVTVVLVEQC